MKKIILAAAAAAFLAAPGGAMAASKAKAPTSVTGCMKMLKQVGADLHKARDGAARLKKMRKNGQLMAKACKDKKFKAAFKTYRLIAKEAAAK